MSYDTETLRYLINEQLRLLAIVAAAAEPVEADEESACYNLPRRYELILDAPTIAAINSAIRHGAVPPADTSATWQDETECPF